jgi:site-specific recombinase XerD
LIKINVCDKNPILLYDRGKQNNKIVESTTINEYLQIVNSIDKTTNLGKRNYLICELLFGTGIRISELINIKLSSIDLTKKTILIDGKGSKQRYVPIHDNLSILLKDYILYTRTNLLVRGDTDTNIYLLLNKDGNHLTQRGTQKMLISIVKKANLQIQITPHKLRHLFGTSMLKGGMKIRDIQKLLGHEEITTTQIYVESEYAELKNKIKEINLRGKK